MDGVSHYISNLLSHGRKTQSPKSIEIRSAGGIGGSEPILWQKKLLLLLGTRNRVVTSSKLSEITINKKLVTGNCHAHGFSVSLAGHF